jgi:hypothetical protein
MDNQLKVIAETPIKLRIPEASFVFIMVAFVIGTFLRISLLLIYPLLVLCLCLFLRLRFTLALFVLFTFVSLSLFLSMFNGWFLKYKILSLYFMLPFLLLLFSGIPFQKPNRDYVKIFFQSLTIIAIINDLVGFVQFLQSSNTDDSFIGIFSTFSISLNGLVIINAVLAFYYFALFLQSKRKKNLWLFVVFLCSSVLGFYGAGLVIILLALIFSFFRLRLKAILKTGVICVIALLATYYLLLYIKPNVLNYNLSNLEKLTSFDFKHGPRKLRAHYNYIVSYPENYKDFLFGSGPGTFNSRSAFMVGSPSYFSGVGFIKSDSKPYYFQNFAYTLWNETNTSQTLYLDGFRNQPFSSALAFLGEYGLLFTLCLGILYYRMYRKVVKVAKAQGHSLWSEGYFLLFRFLIILLPLLLCIDNFYEFPEIMILILLPLKLLEIELSKKATGYKIEPLR